MLDFFTLPELSLRAIEGSLRSETRKTKNKNRVPMECWLHRNVNS